MTTGNQSRARNNCAVPASSTLYEAIHEHSHLDSLVNPADVHSSSNVEATHSARATRQCLLLLTILACTCGVLTLAAGWLWPSEYFQIHASALNQYYHSLYAGGAMPMNESDSSESMEMQWSTKVHRRLLPMQEEQRVLESASAAQQKNSALWYVQPLTEDLQARQKLFQDTPPEEIKYWFEYAGPLQKYFYRFSRSRGKADYFEGRDDSGVVSARFMDDTGGNVEFRDFFIQSKDKRTDQQLRMLENCLAMGHPVRPVTREGSLWHQWYANDPSVEAAEDRCRVLFAINTVGSGRGTSLLWETNPPTIHAEGPIPWTSEQETAATHLERNLKEIDSMCESGYIAARVQILVCEPIPAQWSEWMDSKLVHCGGKPWPLNKRVGEKDIVVVEDRPSPLQVVVTASVTTADTCHDLKSGFMEKRLQDLLLAPPFLDNEKYKGGDPTVKTTNADLVSSDDHDLYVALKWTSLVTIRSIHAFLQASADISAAASSSVNLKENGQSSFGDIWSNGPSSPFLVPSFVRVAYVSEENNKVAKWRMHGDFFHPAAWEICKDSFETTWIPHSLSGSKLSKMCLDTTVADQRQLRSTDPECGQWWIYMTELQMPTSPEVYANEVTPAPIEGGSNYIWMLTELQRREIVKGLVCRHEQKENCSAVPQAVLPLGDLESFLINFTPNTALGKQHLKGRRPGYSREEEREADRVRVKERKQLHDQEEIEKALFDYTIYPAALFHKDATLKAARARDVVLSTQQQSDRQGTEDWVGPKSCKSSYYDVTITKPREAILGWCQAIARRGLCTLYADYFRTGQEPRCLEACGLKRDWSKI